MDRPPRFGQRIVEFAVRRPQPTLRNRSVGFDGTLEHDLVTRLVEDTEHDEQVRVLGGARHPEAGGQRTGELGVGIERRAPKR